jgi:hypothetical protein
VSIDARQLSDLTDEVDQLHHESMRTFREEAEEIHFGEPADELRQSRRDLFKKAGAGGALLSVATIASPVSGFLADAFAKGLDDAAIVTFSAGVEFAAVAAYQVVVDSGRLEPAVLKTAKTFQGHHRDHGRAFNTIITATTERPSSKVLATFNPKLAAAKTQNALLEVAYTIEETLAATYLSALGALQDKTNAQATAAVLPVESQHAVVLGLVLKKKLTEYMPPFQNSELALDPTKYSA